MLEEGKLSEKAARILALVLKKKVRNIGAKVRNANSVEEKLDLLSKQNSALGALILTGISVSGDGLLTKAGIVSGMFAEEEEEDTPLIN
jgi:hypothetical protein